MKHSLLAGFACLAAGACAQMQLQPLKPLIPQNSASTSPQQQAREKQAWEEFYQLLSPPALGPTGSNTDLGYALVSRSDTLCDDYMTRIAATRSGTVLGLDIGSQALGAIGSVVGPVDTANAWSAASVLATGGRASLEKEILGGREFGLIFDAVRSGRETMRAQLFKRFESGDFDQWAPYRLAVYLDGAYHVHCGLNYGLSRMRESEAQVTAAERRVLGDPLDTTETLQARTRAGVTLESELDASVSGAPSGDR